MEKQALDIQSKMLQTLRENKSKLTRKSNKPLIEKRRRLRINKCLDQLKAMVVQDNEDANPRSKLEKADILEMTVNHLRSITKSRKQENSSELQNDYRTGYRRCIAEVIRYLAYARDSDHVQGRGQLISHLTKYLSVQPKVGHSETGVTPEKQVHLNSGMCMYSDSQCSPANVIASSQGTRETIDISLPKSNDTVRKELFNEQTHAIPCGTIPMAVLVSGQTNIVNVQNAGPNRQAILFIKDLGMVDSNHNMIPLQTDKTLSATFIKCEETNESNTSFGAQANSSVPAISNRQLPPRLIDYEQMWRPW